MKNKMLLITCIALFFTGCASVKTADTDKPSLTPDNSVLIYGYIDDISEITFIKQSPDFKYELIEGITHSDNFVLPPVPADSELKLYKYETSSTNFFAATSSSEEIFYGIGGVDIKFNGPQIFYLYSRDKDLKKEKEALEYAISQYKNTAFKPLLEKRLGEISKWKN